MKNQKGITLVALVITIIVLLILAIITLNLTIWQDGIIKKGQEAKKAQIIAEAKEQISLDILNAQMKALEKSENLEQQQLEDIISKYGELQEDGDTIILKDNGYEVSLIQIYNTVLTTTDEDSNTELAKLKAMLSQTTVTEDKILKGYKAYKDEKIITGTMENYDGISQDTTTYSDDNYRYFNIPNDGYYTTNSTLRMKKNELGNTNIIYSVSIAIYNQTANSSGQIAMPTIGTTEGIVGGRSAATVLSDEVKLVANNKLTLPKGSYSFESFVPVRTSTYGTGYKVFDLNGNLLVDHTFTGTTSNFASNDFTLNETTDIVIYWYRTHIGWIDLTYYSIKAL